MSNNKINLLQDMLSTTKRIFSAEPAVVVINSRSVMIVGDIHGDLAALEYILAIKERKNCKTIIFLGDYIDRGLYGVEVLIKLFELKIRDPKHIILLRGNHEDFYMNVEYGFFDEINRNKQLLMEIDKVYNKMPIAAILNKTIFCVHAGLDKPRNVSSISKSKPAAFLWNDPSLDSTSRKQNSSVLRQKFSENTANKFLELNNLSLIIRGHTALMDGFIWLFDDKLLSLFSSPNYINQGNKGSYAIVDKDRIEVFVFDTNLSTSRKKSSHKIT